MGRIATYMETWSPQGLVLLLLSAWPMIAALSTDPTWLGHFMCDFMCAQLLKVKTTPLPLEFTFVVKRENITVVYLNVLISKHDLKKLQRWVSYKHHSKATVWKKSSLQKVFSFGLESLWLHLSCSNHFSLRRHTFKYIFKLNLIILN